MLPTTASTASLLSFATCALDRHEVFSPELLCAAVDACAVCKVWSVDLVETAADVAEELQDVADVVEEQNGQNGKNKEISA